MLIVGLDWSRGKHDYLLMTTKGDIIEQGAIPHSAEGLQELAARIEEQAHSPQEVRVGIEMNDGALLASPVHSGYTVFGIQPKSAQRARDIYRPSASKDDRIDAFVLAEFAGLNQHRLQPLQRPSGITQDHTASHQPSP